MKTIYTKEEAIQAINNGETLIQTFFSTALNKEFIWSVGPDKIVYNAYTNKMIPESLKDGAFKNFLNNVKYNFTSSVGVLEERDKPLPTKECNKSKEKFTFVRNVETVPDILIALGEGLYLSRYDPTIKAYYFHAGEIKIFNNPTISTTLTDLISMTAGITLKAYKKESEEWYENIPKQGVLCWVSDSKDRKNYDRLALIFSYDPNNNYGYMFGSRFITWRYAIPVKREEIENFILDQPYE